MLLHAYETTTLSRQYQAAPFCFCRKGKQNLAEYCSIGLRFIFFFGT